MAIGMGGQFITVVPDHDLVVVFTSGLAPRGGNDQQPVYLTNEYVVAAVASDEPLPPDGDAQARLADAVEAARSAPAPAPVDLPPTATVVDGARYEFRPNDFGNQWFALSFGEDSASIRLDIQRPRNPFRHTDTGEPVDLKIGLDDCFIISEFWGQPIAARGTWRGDDTFLIEFQFIHLIARGTFEFTFTDDGAGMEYQELVSRTNQWSQADRVG
jgi:hypothetical protein